MGDRPARITETTLVIPTLVHSHCKLTSGSVSLSTMQMFFKDSILEKTTWNMNSVNTNSKSDLGALISNV